MLFHVFGSKDELVFCSTSSEGNAASLLAGTDMNCVDYGALRQSLKEGLIKVNNADLQIPSLRILTQHYLFCNHLGKDLDLTSHIWC